jgi:hypothetical protein
MEENWEKKLLPELNDPKIMFLQFSRDTAGEKNIIGLTACVEEAYASLENGIQTAETSQWGKVHYDRPIRYSAQLRQAFSPII